MSFDKEVKLLSSGYESALIYVVYNGPPNTIYNRYNGYLYDEEGLIKAIKFCKDLYRFIKNPSEKVICSYIEFYGTDGIKNSMPEITKNIAKSIIINDYNKFNLYSEFFNNDDVIDIIKFNPHMIKFNPHMIKYANNQTYEMCNDAITRIYNKRQNKIYSELFYGGSGIWHNKINANFAECIKCENLNNDEINKLYAKLFSLDKNTILYIQ